jgi:FixJ family two-component response regulator
MSSAATVFVVNDDIAVLKALTRLLNAEGLGFEPSPHHKLFWSSMILPCLAA